MKRLVLFLLLAAGCETEEDKRVEKARLCGAMCINIGKTVDKFDAAQNVCTCKERPYGATRTEAGQFCDECAKHCAPTKMLSCKFGNDTWGAGPDVCECEKVAEKTP